LELGKFGYFKSSPYAYKKPTDGSDNIIAKMEKISGHVVSSVVTGYPYETERACCEGDARIHLDGIRTPSIESDGSESYACYGYGFCAPPQTNPISGYDGKSYYLHEDWSMMRSLPGEVYPFLNKIHFGFESFGNNEINMCHSGAILFYGENRSRIEEIGNYAEGKEILASYFEGDDDDVLVTLYGSRAEKITMIVNVDLADEIVIRRVSDQKLGRQFAEVYINGVLCETPWYYPDSNEYKRWLEDEYIIPSKYFIGCAKMKIEIVPKECGGKATFNQFGIKILRVFYG